jgi:hypothetical protein
MQYEQSISGLSVLLNYHFELPSLNRNPAILDVNSLLQLRIEN